MNFGGGLAIHMDKFGYWHFLGFLLRGLLAQAHSFGVRWYFPAFAVRVLVDLAVHAGEWRVGVTGRTVDAEGTVVAFIWECRFRHF